MTIHDTLRLMQEVAFTCLVEMNNCGIRGDKNSEDYAMWHEALEHMMHAQGLLEDGLMREEVAND